MVLRDHCSCNIHHRSSFRITKLSLVCILCFRSITCIYLSMSTTSAHNAICAQSITCPKAANRNAESMYMLSTSHAGCRILVLKSKTAQLR